MLVRSSIEGYTKQYTLSINPSISNVPYQNPRLPPTPKLPVKIRTLTNAAISNTDDESRAQKIDDHKTDSLEKAKTGKGEWKPELASQSEQIAQAEKHDMTMEEMQKMGKEKGEKEQK